ncbi:MAG: FAD-binding oxidoreductase [Anaerolineae bacterium]|nr:FAD-binding oxidoreductase [Anaerolineae bacterium]
MSTMPTSCDVVVIGAGLAGALVARRLAQDNLKVLVLEADRVGAGATGHTGGVALVGTPGLYAKLVDTRGEIFAANVWELSSRNLDLLIATAASLAQEVEEVGSLRVTGITQEAQLYERSVSLLQKQGVPVSLEDATELGFLVGLQTRGDLAFDPAKMTQALLDHPGIEVATGIEVRRIESRQDCVAIWAKRHYVVTKAVVLAAGAHTARMSPTLAKALTVCPMQVVDCEVAAVLALPLVLDEGRVLVRDMGSHWRLVAWTEAQEEDPWTLLAATAERLLTNARILNRYTTWVPTSMDGLPIVGEVPDLPRVYTISGLGPWGLGWVFVAADGLMKLMLHDESPGMLGTLRLNATFAADT